MGLGIEIREQFLDREGLGSLVWYGTKIQLNQRYRLGGPVSQRHIATRKFLKNPPPPSPPLGKELPLTVKIETCMVLDSWLVSFISNHHWKQIYNLPRLQQTKSWHHLPWRISVLVWALFLLCSSAILQTPATGLNIASRGWILQDGCFSNTSVETYAASVLDRFIAIVHPLQYTAFMTRRPITQVLSFSWFLIVSYNVLKVTH